MGVQFFFFIRLERRSSRSSFRRVFDEGKQFNTTLVIFVRSRFDCDVSVRLRSVVVNSSQEIVRVIINDTRAQRKMRLLFFFCFFFFLFCFILLVPYTTIYYLILKPYWIHVSIIIMLHSCSTRRRHARVRYIFFIILFVFSKRS